MTITFNFQILNIDKNTWKSELNIISKGLKLGDGSLRVMIKDSIDIQGELTTLGSKSRFGAPVAQENADVVKNILNADCQIVGKVHLHELAFGITGINKEFGTPVNVKYPDLIPGGSSSGSAASVAAGLADFSIGTDTGGSIRMPAACCGVFGFKPTFGRVSRKGVWPKDSSLDCVGPFAESIQNLIQAMCIIDPTFKKVEVDARNLKIGVVDVSADKSIWNVINDQLNKVNAEKTFTRIDLMDEAYRAGMLIINYETWGAYQELTQSGLLGEDIQKRLLKASETTESDVQASEIVREKFTNQVNALLDEFDVLILPTLPNIPPKLSEAENTVAFLNLTELIRPFNLSGHPALTIPFETMNRLPVGMQLIGKHGEDEKLCAIAEFIVESTQHSQGGG